VRYSTTKQSPILFSPSVFANRHIYGAILFEKCYEYIKQLVVEFCSWMIENGITKKINTNTTIFNSVINVVQTCKVLFTWRHNVAPTNACKNRSNKNAVTMQQTSWISHLLHYQYSVFHRPLCLDSIFLRIGTQTVHCIEVNTWLLLATLR
jgi:hypothetical protein